MRECENLMLGKCKYKFPACRGCMYFAEKRRNMNKELELVSFKIYDMTPKSSEVSDPLHTAIIKLSTIQAKLGVKEFE